MLNQCRQVEILLANLFLNLPIQLLQSALELELAATFCDHLFCRIHGRCVRALDFRELMGSAHAAQLAGKRRSLLEHLASAAGAVGLRW